MTIITLESQPIFFSTGHATQLRRYKKKYLCVTVFVTKMYR